MKISKHQEAAAIEAYKVYFDSYIGGNAAAIAAMLNDDYTQIGSAESEVFFNRDEALKFLNETIEQVAGKAAFRNRVIKCDWLGEYVMVIDLFDMYVLAEDEWIFYSKFRASTLMEYRDKQWRFVHQHSSVPDVRTDEGDNIAIEKISAENLRLRDAIKRRTIELEQKNRELEIETSLEKIRSSALSMHEPDDMLDVCRIIAEQLIILGVEEIRNVQTVIINELQTQYLNYQYFVPYNEKVVEVVDYRQNDTVNAFVEQMLTAADAFFSKSFEGIELSEWVQYRKDSHQLPDPKLEQASSAHYYFYSIGVGALGVSTYRPLNDESLNVFKRFRNVFDLAYRRYDDIKNAELQAREARIEVALEKVRSRSMSMLHSEELKEVISLVLEQIRKLDIPAEHAGFYIDYKQRDDWHIWLADPNQIPFELTVPYFDCLVWHNYNNAKKQGLDSFAYTISFEEKNDFYEKMFRLFPIPEEARTFYMNCPGLSVSTVLLDTVGLYVENFSGTPYSEEENRIVKRFGKVFQQTYTRFLDLQRAEEQTKEAEIQLALERVRARAMAMHSSQELNEVVHVLRKQMGMLGQSNLETCVIHLHDESPDSIQSWAGISPPDSGGEILETIARVPKKGLLIIEEALAAYAAKQQEYVIRNEGEKLMQWFSFLEQASPDGYKKLSDSVDGNIAELRSYWSFADFNGGSLLMVTRDEPDEPTRRLLGRFSQVFGLAYRRFADLKQAEAQAREAKIEAALERVRSRTMGMQKSDELPEAANLLFHQVQQLSMPAWSAGYCTWNDDQRNSVTLWMSSEGVLQPPFTALTTEDPLFMEMRKGAEVGKALHVVDMGGEALAQHYQYMRTLPVVGSILDSIIEAGHPLPTYQIMHQAYFSKGFLLFITYQPVPEAHDIFKRFAAVFDQTYTRFLDLKKAEAQARESQIQLAMERVRARTMAMQKSDELAEVSSLLFQQLKSLGLSSYSSGFTIWDNEKKDLISWMCNADGSMNPPFVMPVAGEPWHILQYESWKRGDDFIMKDFTGNSMQSYFRYLRSFPLLDEAFGKSIAAGHPMPERQIHHVANFSHGNLLFITLEPCWEAHDIFKRFAKVFDQTYIRFLDLQKAEAQAREAKVEAALERIRSKSMAMHKSAELQDLSFELVKQVQALGVKTWFCAFNIYDNDRNESTEWGSNADGVYPVYKTPREGIFLKYYDIGQRGAKFHVEEIGEDRCAAHYEWLCTIPGVGESLLGMKAAGIPFPVSQIDHVAYFKYGYILYITYEPVPESYDTFQRFAKVFEQTYTRFLDLRKSEAQAREAQIEAALEKVRSRSLAMHKSEEIKEVVKTVVERIRELDIEMNGGVSLVTFVPESKDLLHWIWIPEQFDEPLKAHLPFFDHVMFHDCNEGRVKGLELVAKTYSGEDKTSYFNHIFNHTGFSVIPEEVKSWCIAQDWFGFSFAIQKHSGIFLNDYTGKFFSAETNDILIRFSKVFEQSFIRFLDLQKAEFQTHQAKIETALEKVRARALAMQQPEELTEVAQVMRNEMGLLGVEELETSSIYIHEEGSDQAECWYAIKDIKDPEKKLVADHFQLNLQDTWVGRQMFDFYQSSDKFTSVPMRGTNRKEWINYCSERSKLLDGFYGDIIPERTYHLYKFSNGTIGAATPGNISSESWDLLQRAASVFSLAYSRFKDLTQARNDLQKLKEAKLRAETALSELQTTQKQLIQAEKLASLGQLTAGIAHEIQNPLNFVNNFSDVNAELLSELKEEIINGSKDEAVMLITDIIENEIKINHHGKRADSIVKGMLEHSRTTSSEKARVDINALADEYLRLAYHGMRGKDNSFNVSLVTDFDQSLGKINITPRDFGRVLLNFYNNAFYAVNEKSKMLPDFRPEVNISTKKHNGEIRISVRDNGNGIPSDILDKIFQPFFTTKPTGQGTGLGLSLSYDIVKAHGGEIKVESEEGTGCVFTIYLPG
jgi:signal transduction histidine kinase